MHMSRVHPEYKRFPLQVSHKSVESFHRLEVTNIHYTLTNLHTQSISVILGKPQSSLQ